MNAILPAFGCTAGGIDFDVALQRILDLVDRPLPAEAVPLESCVGRVLREPITARVDLPPFDQSAMDGYAVRTASLIAGAVTPVTGRTATGEPPSRLAACGVHRVLTGAALPDGADAVIAQEHVRRDGDLLTAAAVPPVGTNIRRCGEDIRAGTALLYPGATLDWRHIAIMASQGFSAIQVSRSPRVALLSTGRELCAAGQDLAAGQIHDSNGPMLGALLTAWGASVRRVPIVADNPATMRAALRAAADGVDLVLTTAGISVGDEDHVRDALDALGGNLAVLKVAMKPGKPLAAGRLGRALFVGLPGNPQAALAGALGFVRPLLARLMDARPLGSLRICAEFALRRTPGRTEFILARLVRRGDAFVAARTGPDGSGRLAPLLTADGFVLLPASTAHVASGDVVTFVPFLSCGDRPR
ncbi:MAG: gephyrin-like molybdotransferase Glp [Acetobacteraceae bacterium]